MHHATFASPDLTVFCRLDELGLQAVGQCLSRDRAVIECRIAEPDPWCRGCGCRALSRGTDGQAGGMLLTRAALVSGLAAGLSGVLSPWRKPFAVHDPGKIIMDLAISLALGGDCLADVGLLRAEPAVYGRVASDPTVSRRA